MGRVAPPPGEPSSRWPWVALIAGVLVVALAVAFFFLNRANQASVNLEGTSTPNLVAAAGSPSPSATLVAPSASLAPAPTAPPSATPLPSPPPPSPPASAPASPTVSPVVAAVPTPSPAQTPAGQASAVPGTPGQATPAAGAPTATAFNGEVSAGGGLGNTHSDIEAAYGAPVGETPDHLVVYRKNNFEYHIGFVPDLNGRASLILQMPAQGSQPLDLGQAQAEAHRLLPRDAQPPSQTPEGNAQFVVEHYTSQTLAQALPPEAFSAGGGQPGEFMVVYARDAQGTITRWVLGPGNDPNALLQQGR